MRTAQKMQMWDAIQSGDIRKVSELMHGSNFVRAEYAIQRMNMVSEWEYLAGPRLTWTRSLQGAWKFDIPEAALSVLPMARQTGTMSAVARLVIVTTTEKDGKHEYSWRTA